MIGMIPSRLPAASRLPEFSPARGPRQGQVGLLAGCAQQVLAPDINAATIRVLNQAGFDVVCPPAQSCCGALDWHEGRLDEARNLARGNFAKFPDDLDAIVTNAAGCGSAICDYGILFGKSSAEPVARRFADQVVDVSVFLAGRQLPPARMQVPIRVACHDACHLVHAQGIRAAPRRLLERIENVELVDLEQSDRCCGSAGTYNLKQPVMAEELGKLKARTIVESGCQIVAAGNVGCLVQIEKYLAGYSEIQALHAIQILDRAIIQAQSADPVAGPDGEGL
jgi:glycolate oxidase iron-sulfur subunit